jgi:hypothetical protein
VTVLPPFPETSYVRARAWELSGNGLETVTKPPNYHRRRSLLREFFLLSGSLPRAALRGIFICDEVASCSRWGKKRRAASIAIAHGLDPYTLTAVRDAAAIITIGGCRIGIKEAAAIESTWKWGISPFLRKVSRSKALQHLTA